MTIMLPQLDAESVEHLIHLATEVKFSKSVSHRRRMGENKFNNLSVYEYSRWYRWDRHQRAKYRALIPQKFIEKAMVGWFLRFPPGNGFLDRMTQWVGHPMAATIVAYSLGERQTLLINDRPVVLGKGEGICFSLQEIHEIKPSRAGQLWACTMVLGKPESFE